MPDWSVQSPVSTVRPTPPRPKAAAGGGSGSTDYIRASSPTNFGTPSWSTDFSSGSVSRSGGTLTLSKAGIWHVSFACSGSCNTTSGAATGAVYYFVDSVTFGIALGTYNVTDSVSSFVGAGGMIVEVATSITVSFQGAGLYSTYDTDVITGESGAHYMAAHWVGP